MNSIFSTEQQLEAIARILVGYLRLPFSGNSIPGSVMESIVSEVRDATVLNTYDFVDVINTSQRLGWQVKSTKADTPVTWKRAKIPDAANLIDQSHKSSQARQQLGDTIIRFCNEHALQSMRTYELDAIGYARLIIHKDGQLTYFEKLLCTRDAPRVFDEEDYVWQWSSPKRTRKKEQLPALHGVHVNSGKKYFAWHGLGENQLHFSGEKNWWPDGCEHRIDFRFPENRLTQSEFMRLLSRFAAH